MYIRLMFPIATTPHVCMYYWLLVLAKFQTDFDDISVDRDYEQFDEQTAQELIESKVCLHILCEELIESKVCLYSGL